MDDLIKEHDDIVNNKPESMSDGAWEAILEKHRADCEICNTEDNKTDNPEGGDMEQTFTKEEVDAVVQEAVAPIQAELDSLKESAAAEEIDVRVAEAKAEAEATVTEMQNKLEDAVLSETNAKAELDNVLAYLASVKEEAEVAEWVTAVRAERESIVKDATNFSDEFIAENLDRWSAESAEDFASRVAEWKASAVKVDSTEDVDESAKLDTAMTNVRKIDVEEKIPGVLGSFLDATV